MTFYLCSKKVKIIVGKKFALVWLKERLAKKTKSYYISTTCATCMICVYLYP